MGVVWAACSFTSGVLGKSVSWGDNARAYTKPGLIFEKVNIKCLISDRYDNVHNLRPQEAEAGDSL